jgi:pyridoxamine 5'-phosphate oxidase
MILATVDVFGAPEVRTVLLKEIVDGAFVFYTNYGSHKAQQIDSNPSVSLLFLWKESERQIRISGHTKKVSEEKSTDYFQKRPRGSQIGAWVSPQSQEIESREELEVRQSDVEKRFKDVEILDRPDFWGGYQVVPQKVEFWQGRDNRLHDRLLYELQENQDWSIKRLAP